jgi:hypothetical protein
MQVKPHATEATEPQVRFLSVDVGLHRAIVSLTFEIGWCCDTSLTLDFYRSLYNVKMVVWKGSSTTAYAATERV